jgi:hypothetical protein
MEQELKFVFGIFFKKSNPKRNPENSPQIKSVQLQTEF